MCPFFCLSSQNLSGGQTTLTEVASNPPHYPTPWYGAKGTKEPYFTERQDIGNGPVQYLIR